MASPRLRRIDQIESIFARTFTQLVKSMLMLSEHLPGAAGRFSPFATVSPVRMRHKKQMGWRMQYRGTEDAIKPAALAAQPGEPRICIADKKRSIRAFIAASVEELGLVTFECAGVSDLDPILETSRPDLVVIGSSVGGIEACQMVELLATRHFAGKVLVLGPRASPMVSAISRLGEQLGLARLPLLPTPFSNDDVRDCIAKLLRGDVSPASSADRTKVLGVAPVELRYEPKIDARRLALSGAAARSAVRNAPAELVIARALADWRHFAARHGHVEIAVELPIAFFRQPGSIETLCRQMPDDPACEGLIVAIDAEEGIQHLGLMKDIARRGRYHNIAIAIDNLGTEWPSLAELDDFPFVELKVDRRLVAGCAHDRTKQATCRRIVALADAMGARAVADGVASRADFLAIRGMGFHQAQGPLFAAPMTAEQFARTCLR
jgi:EAL domain-containing protein (putative c-di-GMP-specific phosphodiesterase class I)